MHVHLIGNSISTTTETKLFPALKSCIALICRKIKTSMSRILLKEIVYGTCENAGRYVLIGNTEKDLTDSSKFKDLIFKYFFDRKNHLRHPGLNKLLADFSKV